MYSPHRFYGEAASVPLGRREPKPHIFKVEGLYFL
jgi:hypothetical protein